MSTQKLPTKICLMKFHRNCNKQILQVMTTSNIPHSLRENASLMPEEINHKNVMKVKINRLY